MSDIIRRLREPPFGTETSERNLMAAAADEIERLRAGGCARDQTTTQFCAEAVRLQAVMERMREWENHIVRDRATLNAEIARLREALQKIADMSVPRPVKFRYRDDRLPSKHDRCAHDFALWEDCPDCASEYARAALAVPFQSINKTLGIGKDEQP